MPYKWLRPSRQMAQHESTRTSERRDHAAHRCRRHLPQCVCHHPSHRRNGSFGGGSAAGDLNTVLTVALDRIEVLLDGAFAQYGSGATTGVVKLGLREARSGGGAQVTYGFYNTDVDTANNNRDLTGEHAVTASGWQGIGFGSDGVATTSGEYTKRQPTTRADIDTPVIPNRVIGRFGDLEVQQYTGFVNAGTSLTDDLNL